MARDKILVTGGGTFLGNHIASALLAEHAPVELLVRPGAEDQLGGLREQITWRYGDVWNAASLKGNARHATTVIHTVGGLTADPAHGLTYQYLNMLSFRNVVDMCISDGTPRCVLLSAAAAPWLPNGYVRAKREAEQYIARVGLRGMVIRAPLVFRRGEHRPLIYRMVSVLRQISPFFRNSAPMPVDIFARGVARLVLAPVSERTLYYASDLWRLNTPDERRGRTNTRPVPVVPPLTDNESDTKPNRPVRLP
jgi:uncharacterized protein YbjT (DUF2867 family)